MSSDHYSSLEATIEKKVRTLAEVYHKELVKRGVNKSELLDDLVSQLGIDVLYYDFEQDKQGENHVHGIYLRSHDTNRSHKIILHRYDNEKMQNFTLLHELFHHLIMEGVSTDLMPLLTDESMLERAGDYFAACFLMKQTDVKVTFEFLSKRSSLEMVIMKMSDAFIAPYESVARRLAELELLPPEGTHLLRWSEEKFKSVREKTAGPTVLDDSSRKLPFQPYVNMILEGVHKREISYVDGIKRLNRVQPERARELEAEYKTKLDALEEDED